MCFIDTFYGYLSPGLIVTRGNLFEPYEMMQQAPEK